MVHALSYNPDNARSMRYNNMLYREAMGMESLIRHRSC